MYYTCKVSYQGVQGAEPPGFAGGLGSAAPQFAGGPGGAAPRNCRGSGGRSPLEAELFGECVRFLTETIQTLPYV